MDSGLQNTGFAANYVPNAFNNMSTTDTTLRLDYPGLFNDSVPASTGVKRKWDSANGPMNVQTRFPFSLWLGHSPSSSDSKTSSATGCTNVSSAKETDEESSMDLDLDFSLHLGGEKTVFKKKVSAFGQPLMVDLELSLSVPTGSDVTTVNVSSPPVGSNFSILTMPTSSVTCSSEITMPHQQQQRVSGIKTCQFEGCGKGARGATGLCIAHGGGRRCQKPGCHKGAEGRTAYCKAHGGGRRCEFLGCTKSSEGRTDFCIAHGGGRRCSHDGCIRAARGKSGLCIRHGGGKRCQKENCTKSAEGLSGLCISHGGGRRCQFLACTKGAQGSTMFCKAHGGGKRCEFEGCTKGAEGSTPFCKGHGGGKRCAYEGGGVCPTSVHGGTLFCVAHGGGKRCVVPGCTRSARGRTDCCVRHGGGKRCQFEGCGKSAQGSTDFCKAHGGGKRCAWGHPGSEYGVNDRVCNAFARGKTGLCASHGALVQDKRVHGGGTLGTLVNETAPTQHLLIPPQIAPDVTPPGCTASSFGHIAGPRGSTGAEGRVHGGSLIHLLAGRSAGGL